MPIVFWEVVYHVIFGEDDSLMSGIDYRAKLGVPQEGWEKQNARNLKGRERDEGIRVRACEKVGKEAFNWPGSKDWDAVDFGLPAQMSIHWC